MATSELLLPDLNALDSDRLKALIVEQHFQLISHDNEIENLKLLILKLQRMQFGRRSEKLQQHIDQLELRLEELETNRASKPGIAVVGSDDGAVEARSAPAAGRAPSSNRDPAADVNGVSGLRRSAGAIGRGCCRDFGVDTGPVQSDSNRTTETQLHAM